MTAARVKLSQDSPKHRAWHIRKKQFQNRGRRRAGRLSRIVVFSADRHRMRCHHRTARRTPRSEFAKRPRASAIAQVDATNTHLAVFPVPSAHPFALFGREAAPLADRNCGRSADIGNELRIPETTGKSGFHLLSTLSQVSTAGRNMQILNPSFVQALEVALGNGGVGSLTYRPNGQLGRGSGPRSPCDHDDCKHHAKANSSCFHNLFLQPTIRTLRARDWPTQRAPKLRQFKNKARVIVRSTSD